MIPERFRDPQALLTLRFPSDPQIFPDGGRVAYVLTHIQDEAGEKEDFRKPRYRSHIFLAELGGEGRQLTFGEAGKDASPRPSPDGRRLAFTRAGEKGAPQAFLLDLAGGEARRLTDPERFKGGVQNLQWSPDGRWLGFFSTADDEDKRDERGEARIITRPVYRFNGRDWLPERAARLYLLDVESGEITEWYAPEQEIATMNWLPDSSGVLFAASLDERRAYEWKQEVFRLRLGSAEPEQLGEWNAGVGSVVPHPDGERFVISGRPAAPEGEERPLDPHFYLFEGGTYRRMDTGWDRPLGQMVGGDTHVGAFPGRPWWQGGETLVGLSTVGGACGLFAFGLDGTVTPLRFAEDEVISAHTNSQNAVALIRESVTRFPEVELYRGGEGGAVTRLGAELPAAAAAHRVAFTNELGEGEGWVLLPDGEERVPAILSIHGGPHTAYGHCYMHEFQTFVANGYGVCYANPRGSVGYGDAWSTDIYGRWGTVDADDLLNFFDRALAAHPRLDPERAAVMGGSYGGFMTNWITAHSARFKAAVTDRSICNLVSFGGTSDIGLRFWHTELGLSFQRGADHERLWEMSPLKHVENVRTPTLIVHSVLDHRCPIEQAEQWYAALTLQGVPTRFVRFPGENHELSRSGRPDRRLVRLSEYLGWLEAHL